MKHVIHLEGQPIEYTLRFSERARYLRMTIDLHQGLVVTLPRRGNEHLVERFMTEKSRWILRHMKYWANLHNRPIIKSSPKDYLLYKDRTLVLVTEGLEFFNRFYDFPYKKISIRNQRTLWGSCTRDGNLQFNYKLVLLPKRLSDYVIVHELCHVREHNHSMRFWKLVAQMIPNYRELRRELHSIVMDVS